MQTRRILVVDDYPAALESSARLLRHLGFTVEEASTGRAAIQKLCTNTYDLAVVDWRLNDMTGLEVATAMKQNGVPTPWILVSGYMDFDIARQAGNLGALRAVSPPFDIRDVVTEALHKTTPARETWAWHAPASLSVSLTPAERWAALVLHACEAESDPSTILAWGLSAGVCQTTIYATCRVLKLPARTTRDFARMLRALRRNAGRIAQLEAQLIVADPRTWSALLDRAGLKGQSDTSVITCDEFLHVQTFVPPAHCGLVALRDRIATD